MATASQLINLVRRITLEKSLEDSDILAYLNQGQLEVAGGIVLPHGGISSPLPLLKYSADVTTHAVNPYVDLPATYMRELFFVTSSTNNLEVEIFDQYSEFLSYYPGLNKTGARVIGCCIRGSRLYYQPVPTAVETLTLHYYKLPTDMTIAGAQLTPDGIPIHMQIPVLTNYAAKEIWALREQDVDGAKPNTNRHDALYMKAVIDLDRFVGPERCPVVFEAERY